MTPLRRAVMLSQRGATDSPAATFPPRTTWQLHAASRSSRARAFYTSLATLTPVAVIGPLDLGVQGRPVVVLSSACGKMLPHCD